MGEGAGGVGGKYTVTELAMREMGRRCKVNVTEN